MGEREEVAFIIANAMASQSHMRWSRDEWGLAVEETTPEQMKWADGVRRPLAAADAVLAYLNAEASPAAPREDSGQV